MGLYQIDCSQCGNRFMWFSGHWPDQRCEHCQEKDKPVTLEQALLQIIELQKEIIRLKEQLTIQSSQPLPNPFIYNPPDLCTDGGLHDYPNPWFATIPPCCKKCNKQLANNITVTCSAKPGAGGTP